MLWKKAAAVSSKDALNDLFGRGRTAAASLKLPPRRSHSFEQSLAASLCQTTLQNLRKRFLFFDAQCVGRIQHLRKSLHGSENMPVHRRMQAPGPTGKKPADLSS